MNRERCLAIFVETTGLRSSERLNPFYSANDNFLALRSLDLSKVFEFSERPLLAVSDSLKCGPGIR